MNSFMKELLETAQETYDWLNQAFREDEKPQELLDDLRLRIHNAKENPSGGPRIIIHVSGGVVQDVKADVDTCDIDVDVLDYDNRDGMEKAADIEIKLEAAKEGMQDK